MATIPAWFDETYYLESKLDQLHDAGQSQYQNVGQVLSAIEAAGMTPFQHFEQFSGTELTSPNPYFNAPEYLANWAAHLNATSYNGQTNWTANSVQLAFQNAGLTPFEHFAEYGWQADVNPSNGFDVGDYLAAKAAQLNATSYEGRTDWTAAEVQSAFASAGIDPISHYESVGSTESLGYTPTPASAGGQTFTLTIGQDNLVGTSGNDVFNAPVLQDNGASLANSLESIDSVDGGAGNDTLNVTLNGSAPLVTPTLTNIENIVLREVDAASTLDLSNATGVQNVTVAQSSVAATVAGLGNIANLAVVNQALGANFTGSTAATLNLGLDTVGTSSGPALIALSLAEATTLNIATNNSDATISGATAAKALNIAATGTNTLNVSGETAATAITVTGQGAVNVGDLSALTSLATLDASANVGGVEGQNLAASVTSLTGGSGNDAFTFGATVTVAASAHISLGAGDDTLVVHDFAAGALIDGGTGTDSFGIDAASYQAHVAGDFSTITNFETLDLTGPLADLENYDASLISGITSVATEGVAAAGAATISNLGANATVTLDGDLSVNDGALTLSLKDASGTNDVLNLNLDSTANGAATVTATTTGIETLNVTTAAAAGNTNVYTLDLMDDDLTTLHIAGNQELDFTAASTMAHLTTIDASANTAGVVLDTAAVVASGTAPLTITGTAVDDTFTLGNFTTVTGNGGDDTFHVGVTTSGQTYSNIVDANAGDILNFGTGVDFQQAQISLASTAVFQDYLDAAASVATDTSGHLSWFQWAGNTYVVDDLSTAATFQNGTDTLIELTGVHDLSHVDATVVGGAITL